MECKLPRLAPRRLAWEMLEQHLDVLPERHEPSKEVIGIEALQIRRARAERQRSGRCLAPQRLLLCSR
eukprot:975906-Prymnesium_polylepis.2